MGQHIKPQQQDRPICSSFAISVPRLRAQMRQAAEDNEPGTYYDTRIQKDGR